MAADTLAVCTERMCAWGLLAGFQTAGWPDGVPLLQYADDTIFFMEDSVEAAEKVLALLDMFSNFSGLSLNMAKSTFIRFGMSEEERGQCDRILSTPAGSLPIRYLGLPLVEGQMRVREWQPVLATMEHQLGGGGVAGLAFVSRGAPCFIEGGAFCYPRILYASIQDTCGGL